MPTSNQPIYPLLPVEEEVAYSAPNQDYFWRPNGVQGTEDGLASRKRLFRYGSKLFAFVWDQYGDWSAPAFDESHTYRALSSSDNGQTWTVLDTITGSISSRGGSEAVVQIGSKLYLIHEYMVRTFTGFTGPGGAPEFTGQTNTLHAYYLDMADASPTFQAANTTEVFVTFPDGALADCEIAPAEAVYRGGDEIVVLHRELVENSNSDTFGAAYSVFNIASNTWTTIGTVAFAESRAYPIHAVFDGTYTHLFAQGNAQSSNYLRHRTLDSSNGLGTLNDVLGSYSAAGAFAGTLIGDLKAYFNYHISVTVFDGEVILTALYNSKRVQPDYDTDYSSVSKIYAVRCTAGQANPTWGAPEDIGSENFWFPYWESYLNQGNAGPAALVESASKLYALYIGQVTYWNTDANPYPDQLYQVKLWIQEYQGSGAWGAPQPVFDLNELWDPWGYNANGFALDGYIVQISPIGDESGTGIGKIRFTASFPWNSAPPIADGGNTVYFFRLAGPSCCCSNFAY